MTAPSDLSVVIGLALLTTDRDPVEDAALARVIAVAGLGDLFPGTQGTPAVSSLTEDGDPEPDWCGWCGEAQPESCRPSALPVRMVRGVGRWSVV